MLLTVKEFVDQDTLWCYSAECYPPENLVFIFGKDRYRVIRCEVMFETSTTGPLRWPMSHTVWVDKL